MLLVIVITSYRQTIFAYPSGGGSYIVSKENLGTIPSLIAGSSLLVDYILTVAVSVAGGVLAIRSAFGFDSKWTVPICLLCVILMTIANLRGLKESGALFAPPTYIYVGSLLLLIVVGFVRIFVLKNIQPINPADVSAEAVAAVEGHPEPHAADAAAGVLLRRRGPVRRRGGEQRRAGVQEARVEERRAHADVDGHHPRHVLHGRVGAGRPPQADPRRRTTPRASP